MFSVCLIEGVRLIEGPLNRGFNVVGQQYRDKPTLPIKLDLNPFLPPKSRRFSLVVGNDII